MGIITNNDKSLEVRLFVWAAVVLSVTASIMRFVVKANRMRLTLRDISLDDWLIIAALVSHSQM